MSATPEVRAEELVDVEIDGVALKAPVGAMIIEVADEAGIGIPRFCYHKKLPIAANCRMCLVEVENSPKPMPACATPVAAGMKVLTRSSLALDAQRGVMEFLLINHPLDCPICDQGGECELQDVAMGFGRGLSRFTERKRVVKDKDLGSLIATDMTRCIHCTRCIRVLEVVAGQKELGATGRGEHTQIGTYIERSLGSEMSGNVIDVCPVGALTSKPSRYSARAWELRQEDTIAPHDSIGSNIFVHTQQQRVIRVVPRENEEINEVWISDRDRFSYQGLNSPDRLVAPMIKVVGTWQDTDWEGALEHVAKRLKELRGAHGAEQIGALVSPVATMEELYLAQKLLRGLGCNNIDHRLRQSDFSDQDALAAYPWLGQSVQDLESIGVVLLIGSNVRKDQPIAAHRLLKAHAAGARVMAVNPVDYAFAFPLEQKLIASPSGMVAALAGVLRAVQEKVGGTLPDGFEPVVSAAPVDDRHRAMAQYLCDADSSAVLLGNGAACHPQAATLRGLAGAVADLCGARMGQFPEAGNTAGAWLAGALPHRGPAGQRPSDSGRHVRAMLEKPCKAYMLLGIEPEYDVDDPSLALKALRAADFVVSLTAFDNASMREYADVLLPIAPFTETAGTLVNAEGRWQSFEAAVSPLGEARPGWKILRVLGNLLAVDGFDYMKVGEIRDELHAHVAAMQPGEAAGPHGAALIMEESSELTRIGDVPIYAVDPIVRRAEALQRTADAMRAQAFVNASEAGRLGLTEAEGVRVRQGGDWVVMPLVVDDRVPDGCVWLPAGVRGSETLGPAYGPIEVSRN